MVTQSSEFRRNQKEIKAAYTLAMVTATYLVLWIPGITSLLVFSVTENREFSNDYFQFSRTLVNLNSVIDPMIYAYRMRKIREGLKSFFVCCRKNHDSDKTMTK